MYLWIKFLHIFFMVAWFAGLFYLPRIFVNLAMAQEEVEYQRLLIMAKKLFRFSTPWAIGTLICGISLFLIGQIHAGWVHAKLFLGLCLLTYHIYCGILLQSFIKKHNKYSHRWYRIFNELPVFILIAAIYLAIFKPF